MASTTPLSRTIYRSTRTQKMKVGDKLKVFNPGDEIPSSIVPHPQMRRLISLGWVRQEMEFLPATKPAAQS